LAHTYRVEDMNKIVSLAKRRGFVFPGSEIYGGFGNSWDYGPLGVLLKENVKAAWMRAMVQERDDVVPIESAIIMNPRVWVASGHVGGFTDPLVDCKQCHQRWRADQLETDRCPNCGGELTEPRQFNLMFKTYVGPVEEAAAIAYLRPETAQGMFVNFKNVLTPMRQKLPFGIAQIGKSFRNEITPGNFIFRTREFEQMELEYFVRPGTADEWFEHWSRERYDWYVRFGMRPENLRMRPHTADELAHYARGCVDVEYQYPFGWGELEGIANRGDFDLRVHEEASGEELRFYDEYAREHIRPEVIEPAAGATRSTLAFLLDAYDEETIAEGDKQDTRVVLHFHPALAPYKAAVLPLLRNRPPLVELAREVHQALRRHHMVAYDETGAIGRRYRRQDEIGTPYCLTVDFQSLDDHTVTIRDRDSMEQVRVAISELPAWLATRIV
jgi:glycyl-tRNA synthetase